MSDTARRGRPFRRAGRQRYPGLGYPAGHDDGDSDTNAHRHSENDHEPPPGPFHVEHVSPQEVLPVVPGDAGGTPRSPKRTVAMLTWQLHHVENCRTNTTKGDRPLTVLSFVDAVSAGATSPRHASFRAHARVGNRMSGLIKTRAA